MSGYPFWEVTLSGLVVSAPTIIVTVWLANRSLRRDLKSHLDRRTEQQTGDFRGITNAQTSVLMARRRPWWRPWA